MKFDIVSDIHSEFYKKNFQIIPLILKIKKIKKSKIICLLGDIGYPRQPLYKYFLQEMQKIYEYVLVISGNHELYCGQVVHSKIHDRIDQICNELNQNQSHKVYYLNKNSVEIDDYVFLGCTLWASVNDEIKLLRNDYRRIRKYGYCVNGDIRKVKICPFDTNRWHDEHLKWLTAQLDTYKEQKKQVIVLTHHSPIYDPDFSEGKSGEVGYYTDLKHLMKEPIVCWCYGHTHQAYKKIWNKVLLQNNPADYEMRQLETIDDYFTVDLDQLNDLS
jgi:predicted MPP superfamily phosphohydrolase